MNKKITILYLILNGFLYSQFYDINLTYETNISIKDEHMYILEEEAIDLDSKYDQISTFKMFNHLLPFVYLSMPEKKY